MRSLREQTRNQPNFSILGKRSEHKVVSIGSGGPAMGDLKN